MVDYSKWDHLELSDDSDVGLHPKADKPSVVAAKTKAKAKAKAKQDDEIDTQRESGGQSPAAALDFERLMNGEVLKRLTSLISSIKTKIAENPPPPTPPGRRARRANNADPDATFKLARALVPIDQVDPEPEAASTSGQVLNKITYSDIILRILDQVKRDVDAKPRSNQRPGHDAFLDGLVAHLHYVQKLQKDVVGKLEKLRAEKEAEMKSGRHDGAHLSKAPEPSPGLVNLNYDPHDSIDGTSDGEERQCTAAGLGFGKIPSSDYHASKAYVLEHPEILKKFEADGLLRKAYEACEAAFDNQKDPETPENLEIARQYIHQSLLLQCCRILGRDGLNILFNRLTKPGLSATEFDNDVEGKLRHIQNLIRKKRKEQEGQTGKRIQIHPEPGWRIQFRVPAVGGGAERAIFEQLAPSMQAALESNSVDRVNELFREMSMDQGEKLLDCLYAADCLETEAIADATTEVGK